MKLVKEVKIITKIGQFYHFNAPAKIQATLGQKIFVNVYHDLTYSLESSHNTHEEICKEKLNKNLDKCVISVW